MTSDFSGNTSRPLANTDAQAVRGGAPGCRLELAIPPELLEHLVAGAAARAADLLSDRLDRDASPYVVGWASAAAYLGMATSTLKHLSDVPRRKVGGSVIFRRDELDAWADAHFEGSPRFHHGSRASRTRMERAITRARPPAK